MRVWEVEPSLAKSEHSSSDPSSMVQRCLEAAQGWVENQRKWFEIRGSENHQQLRKYESIANRLFLFGVSTAFILFLSEFFSINWLLNEEYQLVLHHVLVFTSVMSLAISAALHGLAEKLVLAEQSKQYHRMAGLYSLASDVIAESIRQNHVQDALKVFEDLGKEALMENGDWLLLHRARPIDIPSVG